VIFLFLLGDLGESFEEGSRGLLTEAFERCFE